MLVPTRATNSSPAHTWLAATKNSACTTRHQIRISGIALSRFQSATRAPTRVPMMVPTPKIASTTGPRDSAMPACWVSVGIT